MSGYLSDSQSKALPILSMISGLLSAIGSAMIIFVAWRKKRLKRNYDRILFAMSTIDFVCSLVAATHGFNIPKSTGLPWAIGNEVSCSFNAFMFKIQFAVPLYNVFLSCYYVMTIRYGMSDSEFDRKYERWIHILPITLAGLSAVVGLFFDVYHPYSLGRVCAVGPYPYGCVHDNAMECTTTARKALIALFTLEGTIIIPSTIISQTNTFLVYWTIRQQENANLRHSFDNRRSVQSSRKLKQVSMQCILYFFAFGNSSMWCTVLRFLESFFGFGPQNEKQVYWLVVLGTITYPSQGFFNAMIYLRPRYKQWKATGKSNLGAMCCILSDPPATSRRNVMAPAVVHSTRTLEGWKGNISKVFFWKTNTAAATTTKKLHNRMSAIQDRTCHEVSNVNRDDMPGNGDTQERELADEAFPIDDTFENHCHEKVEAG